MQLNRVNQNVQGNGGAGASENLGAIGSQDIKAKSTIDTNQDIQIVQNTPITGGVQNAGVAETVAKAGTLPTDSSIAAAEGN